MCRSWGCFTGCCEFCCCCCCARPVTEPPTRCHVPPGKVRICVAGFRVSLNCGLAQKLADAIVHATQAHSVGGAPTPAGAIYESWYFFPGPGLGWDPYRAFINDTIKPLLAPKQHEKHNWHSAPFCWLEFPDGRLELKGGCDRLREWALETFPASEPRNKAIRVLAGREPTILQDEFFRNRSPGTAVMYRAQATIEASDHNLI